eukprot:5311324-Pleurochrysis_carterae.AAC.2
MRDDLSCRSFATLPVSTRRAHLAEGCPCEVDEGDGVQLLQHEALSDFDKKQGVGMVAFTVQASFANATSYTLRQIAQTTILRPKAQRPTRRRPHLFACKPGCDDVKQLACGCEPWWD